MKDEQCTRKLLTNETHHLQHSTENNFEIYENLNREDNCPVKSTRKRLTNRNQFMRRNIDRRSTASDDEQMEEFSFRQLSGGGVSAIDHKRHSIVAESIMSCESEVSTTSTFLCSNQSEVSHVPTSSTGGHVPTATAPKSSPSFEGVGPAAGATSKPTYDRNKELATTSRSANESDEDNAVHKSRHQRRHAINITSNPGYQVSGWGTY